MNTDLWDFLKTVSQAGEYDSTGHFTVDVHKRRMKLRANLLLDPTHAVLCCIRAGVTSGAASIEIKLGLATTTVTLFKTKELMPKELLESILGTGQGAETERLLGAAFQGALGHGCRLVEVTIPGARVRLTANDMKVDVAEEEEDRCRIDFHYPLDRYRNHRRCAAESAAIFSRATFCPVPLSVDGEPVNEGRGWERLLGWQRTETRYGVSPDFVWLEAMLCDVGEPFPAGVGKQRFRLEYINGERSTAADWDPQKHRGFLRIMPKLADGKRRIHSLTRLGSSLEGPSYYYPLKQGVILEPVEADLGAAAVAVVARADHLDVDLSFFQVVQDERFEKLIGGLRAQTKALVHRLGQDRKAFMLNKDAYLGRGIMSTVGWGLGAAILLVPAGPWGALLGGCAASSFVFFLHSLAHGDRALTSREQRVWWEIDSYVDSVHIEKGDRLRL